MTADNFSRLIDMMIQCRRALVDGRNFDALILAKEMSETYEVLPPADRDELDEALDALFNRLRPK